MKIMNEKIKQFKYNYIYRLTRVEWLNNPSEIDNAFYIGVHSTNNLNDGYMGSSVWLKTQKHIGNNTAVKKDIIAFFDSREEAVRAEIYLHNVYDVAKHNGFFNLSKQTSIGFDISGNVEVSKKLSIIMIGKNKGKIPHNKGKTNWHTEEAKKRMSEAKSGKKRPQLLCEYCEKYCSDTNFSRHQSKCKTEFSRFMYCIYN